MSYLLIAGQKTRLWQSSSNQKLDEQVSSVFPPQTQAFHAFDRTSTAGRRVVYEQMALSPKVERDFEGSFEVTCWLHMRERDRQPCGTLLA
jgi:hypothetical protein